MVPSRAEVSSPLERIRLSPCFTSVQPMKVGIVRSSKFLGNSFSICFFKIVFLRREDLGTRLIFLESFKKSDLRKRFSISSAEYPADR